MKIQQEDIPQPLVLFDGVCNLCNAGVQFLLKRNNTLFFASLQSETGQAILNELDMNARHFQTFLFIRSNIVYQRSDAAIEIARELRGGWKVLRIFTFIPRNIRDFLYTFIAKNRYRIFGKKNSCMIPGPELQNRFLD